MTVSSSLLNLIPVSQPTPAPDSAAKITASINISDIEDDLPRKNEEPLFENDFWNNIAQKIKQKIFDARIKKLENTPAEKRTSAQQAEYEANERSIGYNTDLDYMV